MGRSLMNCLYNLGIKEDYDEALREIGWGWGVGGWVVGGERGGQWGREGKGRGRRGCLGSGSEAAVAQSRLEVGRGAWKGARRAGARTHPLTDPPPCRPPRPCLQVQPGEDRRRGARRGAGQRRPRPPGALGRAGAPGAVLVAVSLQQGPKAPGPRPLSLPGMPAPVHRHPPPPGRLLPGQYGHPQPAGVGLRHPLHLRHVPPGGGGSWWREQDTGRGARGAAAAANREQR
jgi:hypothetical protein